MTDLDYIRRSFELAKQGLGTTWPNPMVGAVIVKDGRIIAEGFHQFRGGDHAEVAAIKNATEAIEGSTVYINLEPCCHTKKLTPPCAQRLIQEKVKRVVIANLDPNPYVNGQGAELLRSHGIEVEHGILAEEGEALNEVFFHAQRTKRPFVHLKLATTLDGKVAMPSGESQWITGEKARAQGHLLRSQHQAVIVGAETARKDNPKLTVRLPNYHGKQPTRIVFSKTGMLPQELELLSDELKHQTLIYSPKKIPGFPTEQIIHTASLEEATADLFQRHLIALLLEGGAGLATEFIKHGLVQRVSLFLNPSLLGAGIPVLGDLGLVRLSERPLLTQITSSWIDNDLYLTGRLKG